MVGRVFGRLTVINRLPDRHTPSGRVPLVRCQCSCGNFCTVMWKSIRRGATVSCGCYRSEVTVAKNYKHGHVKHPAYTSWRGMLERCSNPNHKDYHSYGGRGVTVCTEWLDFAVFWRDMGESWKAGLTIERRSNDGGYCKDNCRWATRDEQALNRRTNLAINIGGRTLIGREAAQAVGLKPSTFYRRRGLGWSLKEALCP